MGGQMTPHTAKHKCRNFLETLLKLAREQPAAVATNVRNLIQGLIDGKVEPELFTTKLQGELSSAPQPCLVPFLKKSLPYLQQSLASGELTIEGVRAPPPTMVPSLPPPQPRPTFQVSAHKIRTWTDFYSSIYRHRKGFFTPKNLTRVSQVYS